LGFSKKLFQLTGKFFSQQILAILTFYTAVVILLEYIHLLPDSKDAVGLAIQKFEQTSRDVAVATAAKQAAKTILGWRLSAKNWLDSIDLKLTEEKAQNLIDAAHSIVEKYAMRRYFCFFLEIG
jgi:nucleoside permease NupC